MRAAPALQVDVTRFEVWQALLALLISTGVCNGLAWAWMAAPDVPASWRLAGVALVLACAGTCATLFHTERFRLRFDGVHWQVGGCEDGAPTSRGVLLPSVDLGLWMLLRFEPEAGQPRCPHRWMALQRWGLEARWHALRCAVYSARLATPSAFPGAAPARADPHE